MARVALLSWFRAAARPLPWREERSPYRVWISEVMLQQTQVATVVPFFERFLEVFPTVELLAAAPEDEVMARWAGLGYYSRARNLIACAREVVARYGGSFPSTSEELSALPGLGPYTVAAVGSLAFGLPMAALDGNVIRVLCRLFMVEEDPAVAATRRKLQELAERLLDRESPGQWNEALMELGATICTPRNPDCRACPLSGECAALQEGRQGALPRHGSKPTPPSRPTVVCVVTDPGGSVLCRRRGDSGMLRGLWELPGVECRPDGPEADPTQLKTHWSVLTLRLLNELENSLRGLSHLPGELEFKQTYSHFQARVLAVRRYCPVRGEPADHHWLDSRQLSHLGFGARDRRILSWLKKGVD